MVEQVVVRALPRGDRRPARRGRGGFFQCSRLGGLGRRGRIRGRRCPILVQLEMFGLRDQRVGMEGERSGV